MQLPDWDAADSVLTTASQSLGVMRQQHLHGLITEHELAERSFHGIITAIEDLTRILRTMEGPVPKHPWPIGTALSVPHQEIGLVLTDEATACRVRFGDGDTTVSHNACQWAWHPEPTTESLAHDAVWP